MNEDKQAAPIIDVDIERLKAAGLSQLVTLFPEDVRIAIATAERMRLDFARLPGMLPA